MKPKKQKEANSNLFGGLGFGYSSVLPLLEVYFWAKFSFTNQIGNAHQQQKQIKRRTEHHCTSILLHLKHNSCGFIDDIVHRAILHV